MTLTPSLCREDRLFGPYGPSLDAAASAHPERLAWQRFFDRDSDVPGGVYDPSRGAEGTSANRVVGRELTSSDAERVRAVVEPAQRLHEDD